MEIGVIIRPPAKLAVDHVLSSSPPSVHHSHPPGPRAKIAQRFLGVAEVGAVDIFSWLDNRNRAAFVVAHVPWYPTPDCRRAAGMRTTTAQGHLHHSTKSPT